VIVGVRYAYGLMVSAQESAPVLQRGPSWTSAQAGHDIALSHQPWPKLLFTWSKKTGSGVAYEDLRLPWLIPSCYRKKPHLPPTVVEALARFPARVSDMQIESWRPQRLFASARDQRRSHTVLEHPDSVVISPSSVLSQKYGYIVFQSWPESNRPWAVQTKGWIGC